MKYFIFFLLIYCSEEVVGQKPVIDTSTFKNWASVGGGGISPDGNYVFYYISNLFPQSNTLVIRSTKGNWERRFQDGFLSDFTEDNRHIVFKLGIDSLCILTLGEEEKEFIPNVRDYKLSKMRDDLWLAYHLTAPGNELVLRHLVKSNEQHFASVRSYQFSDNSRHLLVNLESGRDSISNSHLKLISLDKSGDKLIWSSFQKKEIPGNYFFDHTGQQLAFIVERKDGEEFSYSLWYYKAGMDTAVVLVNDQTLGLGKRLQISNSMPEFISGGRKILFKVQTIKKMAANPDAVMVDIWSYIDTKLQSLQLEESKYAPTYTSVMDLDETKCIRLEKENERLISHNAEYALVEQEIGNIGVYESNWNLAAQLAYYLVSMKNGSRILIKDHIMNFNGPFELSPNGKWIVYYDFKLKNYFSYQLATGITRNISKKIFAIWTESDNDTPEPISRGGIKWLVQDEDESVLINDNFDIWQIDLEGIRRPINLTNGYGLKHLIKLEIFNTEQPVGNFIDQRPLLLIRAFNTLTKDMGFYSAKPGVSVNPEYCIMGPYVYGFWNGYHAYNYPPIKAADSDTYLVLRMSAKEAPNYFVTTDFKKYTPLSDVQPQKAYNWMTTELIHWNTSAGNSNYGILYKPENFDPSRKYPIIFDIYEIRSDELNLYIQPKASDARINIPWFVSNGYLVCTPDIHYKIGEPGLSAYSAVISATSYLSKMPWVDARKIGIQGHSFGGYETNYIVTHTHLFAAACAAAGLSDLISMYGSTLGGGFARYHAERQQGRMGATLWQIPDLYVKNSPIFNADKVSTPLLLVNNKEDIGVPFTQGVEFFTALRRLGKKVWMLQYDGSGHSISTKAAMDYHIRMVQFFDHYLKGKLAPRWMTRGIPAVLKGIDNGLDLDDKIKTPGPGLNLRPPNIN